MRGSLSLTDLTFPSTHADTPRRDQLGEKIPARRRHNTPNSGCENVNYGDLVNLRREA